MPRVTSWIGWRLAAKWKPYGRWFKERHMILECRYCAKPFYVWDNIEIHHIKELAKGGAMTKTNLSAVHRVCHNKLHNMTRLELKRNNKSWEAHLARSRMKGDFHVRFWSRVVSRECTSTIISSHPEAEEGFKGTAVRRLKWNVSWV